MKKIIYVLIMMSYILTPKLFASEIEITFLDKDQICKINNLKYFKQNQIKEKLDSIVNIDKKYVFNYNSIGQFINEIQYNLDYFTNFWVKNINIEYFYNDFNQLTTIKYQDYEGITTPLEVNSYITYIEYNLANNIKIIKTDKILNTNNTNFLYDYKEYQYDELNNLIGFIHNRYQPSLNKLIGINKFDLKFNEKNQIIRRGEYKWDYENNDWFLFYYFENEYNDYDSLINSYYYQYRNNSKTYEINLITNFIYSNNNKLIYKYHKFGNTELINVIEEYLYIDDENLQIIKSSAINKTNTDYEINNFTKIKKDNNENIIYKELDDKVNNSITKKEYKYNNNNILIEDQSSKFDFELNEWLPVEKFEYLYDSNNNYIGFNKFDSYQGSIDLLIEKEFIVYDLNTNIENILFPNVEYIDTLKSKRLNKQYFKNENKYTELQKITDEKYYYSDFNPTSVKNEAGVNPDFLIFPNPSSEKISVDLGGVEVADLVIYDILGNEIMSIPNYTNKSEIDISTIPIGTYTIQIQTSSGSISQRLLVNR